jgi:hypothetical protein
MTFWEWVLVLVVASFAVPWYSYLYAKFKEFGRLCGVEAFRRKRNRPPYRGDRTDGYEN